MARRIVDLSQPIAVDPADGHFVVTEYERLEAGHSVHHRVDLDTSVGTHVVAPRHLLRWGDALNEIPAETFFGEGFVARVGGAESIDVGSAELEEAVGGRLNYGDIVVLAPQAEASPPRLSKLGAQWLFVRGAKLVVVDARIELGETGTEDDRRGVLSAFFESGVPVVLGAVNTDQLSLDRFAVMALPLQLQDVAAWPVRVIALDPGGAPGAESNGAVAPPGSTGEGPESDAAEGANGETVGKAADGPDLATDDEPDPPAPAAPADAEASGTDADADVAPPTTAGENPDDPALAGPADDDAAAVSESGSEDTDDDGSGDEPPDADRPGPDTPDTGSESPDTPRAPTDA